jgi:hypothetical protein
MNRTQHVIPGVNGKIEGDHAPLVIAENRSRSIVNPTKVDVDELVATAQLRVEQTLERIEKIVGRAGMEAEIVNDVVFQRCPDGTELVTVKRQVRLQKDPL